MSDVRLLYLYKQHYLNDYKSGLNFDISCFGYYDELKIEKCGDRYEENSDRKKSGSPLYQIWYDTGIGMSQLEGRFGVQTIGLFRKVREGDNEFWQLDDQMPYFFVGFVKVSGENENVRCLKEQLETDFLEQCADDDVICDIIVYYTFDNADLVVLMHANSLKQMTKCAEKICRLQDVKYLHSIVGIRENYLLDCANKEGVLPEWHGRSCHIDEQVDRMTFKAAIDGGEDCIDELKAGIWRATDASVQSSYSYGHGNLYIEARGGRLDVGKMIQMMKPDGVLTHKNDIYGNGLYNIETSFYMSMNDFPGSGTRAAGDATLHGGRNENKSWCGETLKRFHGIFVVNNQYSNTILKDEGIFSIFQAFMKTLNTLYQCEGFEMSNDIWFLIAPTVILFADKLKEILNDKELLDEKIGLQVIKDNMKLYIESVNSIIYHMIHTDQMYLMIPGYSGTSFSISAKVSLFFLWYMQKLEKILNDRHDKYAFILNPIMESKPSTMEIDLGVNNKVRLICLKVSQRHLHMPRHLMLILGHEAGHYIGADGRCRKKRMDCILRILAYLLTEAIFPGNYEGNAMGNQQRMIFDAFRESKTEEIHNSVLKSLGVGVRVEFEDRDYHAKQLRIRLYPLCMKVLSGMEYGVDFQQLLFSTPETVRKLVRQDESDYMKDIKYISSIQNTLEENRMRFICSGMLQHIIDVLINVYQEIYADVVTMAVLECPFEDYETSYAVSEGFEITDNRLYNFRKKIVWDVFFAKRKEEGARRFRRNRGGNMMQKRTKLVDNVTFVMEHIFDFVWMTRFALEYAFQCGIYLQQNSIAKQKETVEKIREMYETFADEKYDCEQIYHIMYDCIQECKRDVEKEVRGTFDH